MEDEAGAVRNAPGQGCLWGIKAHGAPAVFAFYLVNQHGGGTGRNHEEGFAAGW